MGVTQVFHAQLGRAAALCKQADAMDPANSLAWQYPTSMSLSLPGLTGGENLPRYHTRIPGPNAMDPANSLAWKNLANILFPGFRSGLTGGENQPRSHGLAWKDLTNMLLLAQMPVPAKIGLAPNGWISGLARHGVSPMTSINLARYGLPAGLGLGAGLLAFNALKKRNRRTDEDEAGMGSWLGGLGAGGLAAYLADRYATPAALEAGITRSPGQLARATT